MVFAGEENLRHKLEGGNWVELAAPPANHGMAPGCALVKMGDGKSHVVLIGGSENKKGVSIHDTEGDAWTQGKWGHSAENIAVILQHNFNHYLTPFQTFPFTI